MNELKPIMYYESDVQKIHNYYSRQIDLLEGIVRKRNLLIKQLRKQLRDKTYEMALDMLKR